MKIIVSIKRVPDPDIKIRPKPDHSGIDLEGVNFVMNPFDAVALEEAIRLREKTGKAEIVLVSIGSTDCVEQLRQGIAMGADRACLVRHDGDLDSLLVARILAKVSAKENPDLILMGKQAADDDCAQAGQMLAGLLDIGQATFISKLEIRVDQALCERETDLGKETVLIKLPAVVTTDLRLNDPRYVSMLGLMRAKKATVDVLTLDELGVKDGASQRIVKLEPLPVKNRGRVVKSVDEFIGELNVLLRASGAKNLREL
ncbi:MAG: electron transfer flavoprotein subunit beta/FixA family protein [Opitutaceae bacterium]|jgi:electron transfer flavoprotein beta subunit